MPSFQIHLAVAKRYAEKHRIEDKDAFIEGCLAPDFVRPKEKSHYAKEIQAHGLLEEMYNKVDLDRYLKENEIKTDYDKGVFLHLLTDKIFFTEFFDKEFIQKTNYYEFTENLYTSYNKTNPYLEAKYPMQIQKELFEKMKQDVEKSRKEKKISEREGEQILPLDKLDAFIERVSNIDIDTYIK